MDYSNFTAEDLAMDPSFRKWVKSEDPASIDFWENWLADHPEKIHTIREAKALLQKLPDVNYRLEHGEFQKMWTNIDLNTQSKNSVTRQKSLSFPKKSVVKTYPFLKVAAIILLLLIGAGCFLLFQYETTFSTRYGETRQITLPDGSGVMLNAHSSVSYPGFWQWQDNREVWLTGEAFFEVRNAAETDGKKFIVHTSLLDVEVMGTSFNVNTRRGKTQVVLNTGIVQLSTLEDEKSQQMEMKPGDLVEFSNEQVAFTKQGVNPEDYSSWKDNKFLCNGTSLGKIAEMAQDRFGLNIQFEETGLKDIEISGTLPLDNAAIFLEVLEESIGKSITKNGKTIIINKQ